MRKSILFCVLMTLVTMTFATDFSEYEIGKKIYKTFEDGRGKWVEITQIEEYDEKDNRIYFKDSDALECWYEYDAKDNKIHWKKSDGYEEWYEYDDKGNQIYYKNSDGLECWYEYDAKGNQIYFKNSDGKEEWYEYKYKESGGHLVITYSTI